MWWAGEKKREEAELDGKKGKKAFSYIPQIRTAPGKVGQKWRVPGKEVSHLRSDTLPSHNEQHYLCLGYIDRSPGEANPHGYNMVRPF